MTTLSKDGMPFKSVKLKASSNTSCNWERHKLWQQSM